MLQARRVEKDLSVSGKKNSSIFFRTEIRCDQVNVNKALINQFDEKTNELMRITYFPFCRFLLDMVTWCRKLGKFSSDHEINEA